MFNTLYISRTGLLEPLGQSQIFAYLRGISRTYAVTLLTFERPEDLNNSELMARCAKECTEFGIVWIPQKLYLRPKLIAPIANSVLMLLHSYITIRKSKICLIHARSYIPAFVAACIYKIFKIPFIFDLRAFWIEEKITAGIIVRDSFLHRLLVTGEKFCLRNAACVISVNHASLDSLSLRYPNDFSRERVVVIPTCVDLDRFIPALFPKKMPVIGCLGSILSGWFRLDWLSSFIRMAMVQNPELIFQITTRDDPQLVLQALQLEDEFKVRVRVEFSSPDLVHEVLQAQFASVMFYAGGALSEIGRSPTRMAEALACGLPVVANAGVGDVAKIIEEFNVGVLVKSGSSLDMVDAWTRLELLRQDPDLALRCRRAAESVFSLQRGTQSYLQVYKKILEKNQVSAR